MFIKRVKNSRTNHVYVSITEGYRDENKKVRHKTIKALGYLNDLEKEHPDVEAYLQEELKKAKEEKEKSVFTLKINLDQEIIDPHTAEKKEQELKEKLYKQAIERIKKSEAKRKKDWMEKKEKKKEPFIPLTVQEIEWAAQKLAHELYEQIIDTPQDPWYNLNVYNIGYGFAKFVYNDLGLGKYMNSLQKKLRPNAPKGKFNHILQLLVFLRQSDPCSKKRTWDHRRFLFEHYEDYGLHDIYRFLDILAAHKDEIIKLLWENSNKLIHRDTSLLLYDGTNFYFDITMEDKDILDEITGEVIKAGKRKKGMSKENRHDPIINMGLLTDRDAIPIDYTLYPGNESEKVHFLPFRKQVKELLGLYERTVYVADCGLNTSDNKFFLSGFNNEPNNPFDGYIYGKSLKMMEGDLKEWAINDDNWDVVSPDGRFKYKEKVWKETLKIEKDGKRNKPVETGQKVVVWFSQKYKDRVMEQIEQKRKQAHYYETHPAAARRAAGQRHVANNATKYWTKEEDLQELEALAGLYSLQTSEIEMSAIELMRAYHDRSRIEDDFRIMKSLLEIRPIFVHLEDRIDGHILTCFIALYILKVLMKLTGIQISCEKVLQAIHDCRVSQVEGNIYASLGYGTTIEKLSRFFGVNLNKRWLSRQEIRRFLKY